MEAREKELCFCGMPQSYPLPHEHDLTTREKLIKELSFKAGMRKVADYMEEIKGCPLTDQALLVLDMCLAKCKEWGVEKSDKEAQVALQKRHASQNATESP